VNEVSLGHDLTVVKSQQLIKQVQDNVLGYLSLFPYLLLILWSFRQVEVVYEFEDGRKKGL
jgi:hypothetical protein